MTRRAARAQLYDPAHGCTLYIATALRSRFVARPFCACRGRPQVLKGGHPFLHHEKSPCDVVVGFLGINFSYRECGVVFGTDSERGSGPKTKPPSCAIAKPLRYSECASLEGMRVSFLRTANSLGIRPEDHPFQLVYYFPNEQCVPYPFQSPWAMPLPRLPPSTSTAHPRPQKKNWL